MEDMGLVRDLAIAWLAALTVGAIAVRFKLPAIAGYVLAGILIGPHGARLISETAQIKVLAELGVALLLFALGVEISLKKMLGAGSRVLLAGSLQIGLSVLAGAAIALNYGLANGVGAALVFGFICALSSTAVVTKVLVDRGDAETMHGRILVPMLLLQDLVLIPVVALLPALDQTAEAPHTLLIWAILKALLLILLVVGAAFFVVPRLLSWVSASKSRELFVLTVICLCLSVALISKSLGVSLALGAFLGGIMISERPYGHQVLADILPVRDLFATVFFVSIGMLLNTQFITTNWMQVLSFVFLLIVGKALIAAFSAYTASKSWWSAALVGISLAQMGEFSFVLATLSYSAGLLPENAYNLFFAGAVTSLVLSPWLIAAAPAALSKLPYFRLFRRKEIVGEHRAAVHIDEHVILCGFGRMGRNVGLTLQKYQIPFVVIEMDGDIVEDLARRGIRHIYGDAFNPNILTKANLEGASCLVVTLPDAVIAMHVISYARQENPNIRIVARANRSQDIDLFRASGANAVIQPEFEASVEATKITLLGLKRPRQEVLAALRDIRSHGYSIFRPDIAEDETPFVEFSDDEFEGVWFSYVGEREKTIEELDIRRRTGATVLAVKRDNIVTPHPQASFHLKHQDEVYVGGSESQLSVFETTYEVSRFCPSEVTNQNA